MKSKSLVKKIFITIIILIVLWIFYNLILIFVVNPIMVSRAKKKIENIDSYVLLLSDCRKLMLKKQFNVDDIIWLSKEDLNKEIPKNILKLNPYGISINENSMYICLYSFPRVGIIAFSKKSENKEFKQGRKLIDGLWSVP
jgi:hypothetical protein